MSEPVFHRTFIEFGNYRYSKLAALLALGSVVAYFRESSPLGRYGGTNTGLTLGVIGAVLILWLMWFGIRKRRYSSRMGTVQGWLSAHVYLGLALAVVATLHTGFQAGNNVHTLAYVLMMIVIVSGLYGVYAYSRFPTVIGEIMGDETLDTIFLKVPGLDMEARRLAMRLPDEINRVVLEASQKSRIGGGVLTQLRGADPWCPTAIAADLVKAKGAELKGADAEANRALFAVLVRKQKLLERARQAVMYKARLNLWLYAHVPLAFALLIALGAHIFSVFFYRA
jgi:hypothetical protein